MASEPRTVKGPCFDCNEQCCFGKSGCVKDHIITMCDCHCDDAEQTAPVMKHAEAEFRLPADPWKERVHVGK